MTTVGIAVAQVRIWTEYKAFQKSTHQVTYINPLSGLAAKRDQPQATAEVDLTDIPDLSDEEKKYLRETFSAGLDQDNIL